MKRAIQIILIITVFVFAPSCSEDVGPVAHKCSLSGYGYLPQLNLWGVRCKNGSNVKGRWDSRACDFKGGIEHYWCI